MILDYLKYDINRKEHFIFCAVCYLLLAFMAYLFYHSILLSMVVGAFSMWLAPFYEQYQVDKRMRQLNMQFKDLLYSLSSSVAAGRQMSEALIEAYDTLSIMYEPSAVIMMELKHMRNSIIENNESDAILLKDFSDRSHNEDISNFVQVYITCRSLGGDLDKIITRAATIISDKMSIEREIQALTAQKKLEGRLIAAMPPAMLLMLNLFSPAYIAPLYELFMGKIIMTFCLAATIFSLWLMEKISLVKL